MMDSFNNEIQVGDRVLCLDAGIYTSHRINQIGSIVQILQCRMIVNFDLADSRDWGYPELNIPSGHSNCLVKNEDKFIDHLINTWAIEEGITIKEKILYSA